MIKTAIGALCLSLVLCQFAHARIFKVTMPDGSVMFTNAPTPGGESVNLRPTTIIPGLAPQKGTPALLMQSGEFSYATLTIVSPLHGYQHANASQPLMVSLAALPGLGVNDDVRLLVDGVPWGVSGPILGFELTNLSPGEHTLRAEVLGPSGEIRKSSRTITVRVAEPEQLAAARAAPAREISP